METLSRLFGSETKVKMLKLFIFNADKIFDASEISERVKEDSRKVRRELNGFEKMGLVKRRSLSKKKGSGYILDHQFSHLAALGAFLLSVEPLQPDEIVKKIGKLGSIKLILIAGIFIQDPESRIDLLVVGDGLKKTSFENTVKTLEAEIGKELRYAYFTTADFKYRISMFDKLTRDILDYPHRMVLNKLGSVINAEKKPSFSY